MKEKRKVPSTVRLTEEAWNLLDEISKKEMWDRNTTIQEVAKYYARQHDITIPERKNDHENL